MNWKFWQKKTPAPKPVMSAAEAAILDHFFKNEKAWVIRRWKENVTPAIRADFQDVTILSKPAIVFHRLDPEATCGAVRFSTLFASIWHDTMEDRLQMKETDDHHRAVAAIHRQLEHRFGVMVK